MSTSPRPDRLDRLAQRKLALSKELEAGKAKLRALEQKIKEEEQKRVKQMTPTQLRRLAERIAIDYPYLNTPEKVLAVLAAAPQSQGEHSTVASRDLTTK